MGQIAPHFKLNHTILRECREQMGLTPEQVRKKIKSITAIESGEKRPTYNQLDQLADLYQVPRWVFIADNLPEEYRYTNRPSFRKFKHSTVFDDSKIRRLITVVEQYRDLFIELRKDLDDSLEDFSPPGLSPSDLSDDTGIIRVARKVRQWLSIHKPLTFSALKRLLEQKSIFTFLTDKYKGWSHIDRSFRGLAITHQSMPIIIINDSDSKKAQSFTLMHELGHILRNDPGIDGDNTDDSGIERWCDQFAGEMLMPASSPIWNSSETQSLSGIKKLAKHFNVSPYACLVRLMQLKKINQDTYETHERGLKKEYEATRQKLKESNSGPSRNRAKEIYNQFGPGFVSTILTSWHNQDMTLHKATRLLGLKRPQQIYDLEGLLS